MEIEVKKKVKVNRLSLYIKVCDNFTASLQAENEQDVAQYEGYVPDFFPGEHYGDYLDLIIDMDTGRILNWVKPIDEDLKQLIEND